MAETPSFFAPSPARGKGFAGPASASPAMGELYKAHPLVSPASARPLRYPPPAPSRKASRIWLAPFRYGRGTNLYSLIPKGEAKPPPLTTPSCFNALPQVRLSTNRGPRGSWCPVGTVQDRRSWLLRGTLSAPRLRLRQWGSCLKTHPLSPRQCGRGTLLYNLISKGAWRPPLMPPFFRGTPSVACGDSSPIGGAETRLPLWGRCHR